ncbi:MAG: beta-lactamase family protein [Candidatus Liptonbacteria bacterium]|nr:beta-lactamase family protein [Candidatus Liptonbacteria bacterium]
MSDLEQRLTERIDRAIAERVFPGCVVGVVRKSGERLVVPRGRFTYPRTRSAERDGAGHGDNKSPVVQADSIFDVASITKSIPTASLALQALEEGQLKLTDRLIDFVPEFQNQYREQVTIWNLLTYTLDWQYDRPTLSAYKDLPARDVLDAVLHMKLRYPPGRAYFYANPTAILLGLVVERVLGAPLDQLAAERFFRPLGMTRTTFHPEQLRPSFSKEGGGEVLVPTEIDPWRNRLLQGEVHDEIAAVLQEIMVPGCAGLFSTAPDLLTFLEMLLRGGELGGLASPKPMAQRGRRYFSEATIRDLRVDQLAGRDLEKTLPPGNVYPVRNGISNGAYRRQRTGLGWELSGGIEMGSHASPDAFGKTGFTGCVVICDVPRGVGLVILSNTTYPKRKPLEEHRRVINEFRRDIADLAFNSNYSFPKGGPPD